MEEQNQNMDELNQNQNQMNTVPSASVPPAAPQGSGQVEPPQKLRFWKFAVWFVAIVVVALAGLWALGDYQERKNIEAFKAWVESTEQVAAEFAARKAADTYGGATPQETLRLYIEAVERGDYELASKYFVLEKQKIELNKLQNSPKENTDQVLSLLRISNETAGSYSAEKDRYVVDSPLFVNFVRYPNGVWKIVEI